MALHEGCRRLRKAGKILGWSGLALLILAFTAAPILRNAFLGYTPVPIRILIPLFLYLGAPAAVGGALLWLSGWISEGFALPRERSRDAAAD